METEALYSVTLANGKKTKPYPLAKIRAALEAGRISETAVVESPDGVTTVKDLCGANLIGRTQDVGSGYEAFCKRRAIRKIVLVSSLPVLALLFLNAAGSSTGFIVPLLFFGFLAALVTAGYVVWAKNDPDPNPAETERRREVARVKAEALAEERAIKNAELAEKRAIKNAELKQIRDDENAKLAAEREIKRQEEAAAAAEKAAFFATQRELVARQNRITELLVIADKDLRKALKLATREGIDLYAEAEKRVVGGAAEFIKRLAE